MSAAFILIGSKVGDLIGRKRAYVLGLLGYAIGALAMALAQSLTAIIIFWAVLGGIGASLLLPAMQSLIHGNFEGAAQKKVYALVGAAAAIAAAVGPLLGGFITTYLSWRVAFLLEVVIIAIVLSGIRLVRDVPYTGPRDVDVGRRGPVRPGHGRHRAGHPGVAGGRRVRRSRSWRSARSRWRALVYWLVRRKRRGRADAARPGSVQVQGLPVRDLPADAPADRAGRHDDRAADLPADGARVQRDAGGPVPRPALAQHVRAWRCSPGRRPGTGARAASSGGDSRSCTIGIVVLIPIVPRADSGWALLVPLMIAGSGLGLLVSQLNNYTLAPISEERVSEAAGVELGGGVVRAVVRAGVRRRHHAGDAVLHLHQRWRRTSTVLPPAEQQHVAQVLEDDAEVMSNTHLEELLADQPPDDPGRDHPHQHRGAADRPSGGAAHPDPRRPRSGCSTRSA